MSQLRNDWLQPAVDTELSGLELAYGKSKTPRKLDRHWGDDEHVADGGTVPVWIRDELGVTESKVREAAAAAGNDSPTVFVLPRSSVPRRSRTRSSATPPRRTP